VDIQDKMIELAKRYAKKNKVKAKLVKGDAKDLKFKGDAFDVGSNPTGPIKS
jgi:ubiquinone/menaquinone biosynthesis C-methylase UbiE